MRVTSNSFMHHLRKKSHLGQEELNLKCLDEIKHKKVKGSEKNW